MNFWLKTLLVMLAGVIGGSVGMAVSACIIMLIAALSPLLFFAVVIALFVCPICGAFSAMWAGDWFGRFLERYD